MKTREQIMLDAFRKLGIPGDGDTLSEEQEQASIQALTSMLKTFQAHHGMPLWKTVEEEFDLSLFSAAGQATLGVGATLNSVTKPLKILDCWLLDYVSATSPTRTPMVRYEAQRFNDLSSPLSGGSPRIVYTDKQKDSYVINLWTIPDTYWTTNGKIRIRYTKTVTDMNSDTDTPDFPEHWEEAIIYGLARRLAPEYGSSPEKAKQVYSDAAEFLSIAESFDNEEGSVYFSMAQRR